MPIPSVLPLFPGVPGGPELLVIFLLMILMFGVPLVLVVIGGVIFARRGDRIDELEAKIEELADDEEASTGGTGEGIDDS